MGEWFRKFQQARTNTYWFISKQNYWGEKIAPPPPSWNRVNNFFRIKRHLLFKQKEGTVTFGTFFTRKYMHFIQATLFWFLFNISLLYNLLLKYYFENNRQKLKVLALQIILERQRRQGQKPVKKLGCMIVYAFIPCYTANCTLQLAMRDG